MMRTNDKYRRAACGHCRDAARTGLSTLEFVGCTMAVVGGAWLGALYLGVDVRQVAHTALAEAELLDNVPPKWRPAAPEEKVMTREQLVATLREELGALRSELTSLRSGNGEGVAAQAAPAGPSANKKSDSTSPQASKEQTLAFWKRINEITLHEATLQHDAELALNEGNSAKVFAIKARISRFAAKSVEAVPNEGVDEAVTQFGEQLAAWFEHGGDLYERAVRIWEMPVDSKSREQLNQEWRRANLHHRNEANLLNEKAVMVRSAVSRQYGADFPEFGSPAATAVNAAASGQ